MTFQIVTRYGVPVKPERDFTDRKEAERRARILRFKKWDGLQIVARAA